MRYLKHKSGDYSSVEAEFIEADALNPRLRSFLFDIDWLLQSSLDKELYVICLSLTMPQYRNLKKRMPAGFDYPSMQLQRPCSGVQIRTHVSRPITISDAQFIKKVFDKFYRILKSDGCWIVEKPSRHIHVQFAYLPSIVDGVFTIQGLDGASFSCADFDED